MTRQGPIIVTLKILLVLAGSALMGLLLLMTIGFIVGAPDKPTADRIREECTSRFASEGGDAVESCAAELMARAADDERQRMLDEAYRAAQKPRQSAE
ncbi:hypothetical protein [Hyphomicrobium sulfonivorans]|uniref:hypothetical protein n=1 Tax=Hyphomicrobium sulfonivorans TaxID=121290 RepID=UPI00156F9826|nr:hypothetical protein [Hyphomicrobium sulfonivorans]MBI1649235.1 hypothetical protein [Hyphomicrobium sulfonivorans]NSL70235.1 hypothetical protein [Hyphomicrobium sulfonivorans]